MRTLATLTDLLDLLAPSTPPWSAALHAQLVIVASEAPASRLGTAGAVLRAMRDRHPDAALVTTTPCSAWPFTHPLVAPAAWPAGPIAIWAPALHEALENAQGNSTHLVTTQSTYLWQVWLDALAARPEVTLVGTADSAVLRAQAPEAAGRRGPWRHVQVIDAPARADEVSPVVEASPLGPLATAFRSPAPEVRMTAALQAVAAERSPAHLVAFGSVCMEVNDLANAAALLDEAVAAAPDWAAAWFERGKAWLRQDDMERAAAAFGRASDLMPTFASAAANWGATLGELDRPAEALAAFTRALAADPESPQALNNVGVVSRELGRLDDSEAAFRKVTALTPDLAFGHYNLGHTLFLQGRYHAAVNSYAAGQKTDPARNPVQASRLALARLAAGDADGALRDLQACTAALPREYRRQILADAHAVAWALLSTSPDLPGWHRVGDWLTAELNR